jgi:hypothetical protein
MAPAAPPLTREEFVSLRDGAKGLMHRIPFEHKARLIELGYIEEVFGGIRLTSGWQDEDCGRLTDLKWPRSYSRCSRPGVGRNPQAARLLKRPQHRNESRHGAR